jgi:cation diffusion facilitator CzcD-associated flavoprotein CzcO
LAEVVEHLDVVVAGAGLSGIGAGYHLQKNCPGKSYAILEGRDRSGGTWDLFRYPGVRSDSDMYTLGYSFQPWRKAKAIADGPSILEYIRDTAREHGIDRKIRYNHRVRKAAWSSSDGRWLIEVETPEETVRLTCSFLYLCTGYYNYENGYTPEWKGMTSFNGTVVHPQKWPEELDYTGKRVVVIGSGATAVTLVPAMAERAAHVTMLQRSPTYVTSLPSRDRIADWLRGHLPHRLAYRITRWKNVSISMFFYGLARKKPELFKRTLLEGARRKLGPDYDLAHFTPSYNPWDQRLCLIPDADLFESLKSGKASVVTDRIASFTEDGLELESGKRLQADIIVTATGLDMKLMSGLALEVDGRQIEMSETMTYKGMMYSDIPNLASALGYTNASWTLKCDLTAAFVCRLVNYMDRNGYAWCVPRPNDPAVKRESAISFSSGYVQRALPSLPKQGSKKPWKLNQNYALDMLSLKYRAVNDGTLEFGRLNGTRLSPRRRSRQVSQV